MIGDIDNNGRINTIDALLCFQIALGVYVPTPEEECRGDANGDGRVNTVDALCIYKEALGIPNECFPPFAFDRDQALKETDLSGTQGAGEIAMHWERSPGGWNLIVALETGAAMIEEFQFDLAFDPGVCEYVLGDFRTGELIAGWPVFGDNLLEPGWLRFAAINWLDAIEPGVIGDLVIFHFGATVDNRLTSNPPPVSLINLDGGLENVLIAPENRYLAK